MVVRNKEQWTAHFVTLNILHDIAEQYATHHLLH